MQFISSDTNVWIDFAVIGKIEVPFRLPYTYIMSQDAIDEELLSPPGIGRELISHGLVPVEISIEEFFLAEQYGTDYKRLSVHDRVALAIAKTRQITLLTGDGALRKAALSEGVCCIGTLGILDQLYNQQLIAVSELKLCLQRLLDNNGVAVRLPEAEISARLKQLTEDG